MKNMESHFQRLHTSRKLKTKLHLKLLTRTILVSLYHIRLKQYQERGKSFSKISYF